MKHNLFIASATALLLTLANPVLAAGDAAAGKEKSSVCAACHGADGNSTIPMNPILAGQYADYLVRALKDYKSGDRQNAIMNGIAAGLSEEDMEDLAAYFSSQSGLENLPKPWCQSVSLHKQARKCGSFFCPLQCPGLFPLPEQGLQNAVIHTA